jgi:dolichol kinase
MEQPSQFEGARSGDELLQKPVSDAEKTEDSGSLHVPSRSPNPYHHLKSELHEPTSRISPLQAFRAKRSNHGRRSDGSGTGRVSASESGTEADDESGALVKALPAPPYRPRKGLRSADSTSAEPLTPLLGPVRLEDDLITFSDLGVPKAPLQKLIPEIKHEEPSPEKTRAGKRRRGEVLRRVSEVTFLGLLGLLVLGYQGVWWTMDNFGRSKEVPLKKTWSSANGYLTVSIISHALILFLIAGIYPLRLAAYSWLRTSPRKPIRQTFALPASSDPAPYIYPTFLPVIVALSLYQGLPNALAVNVVLGIAALPRHLVSLADKFPVSSAHWVCSVGPILIAERLLASNPEPASAPESPFPSLLSPTQIRETLASLFPLHQFLVVFLNSFTGTSLLSAELELLSISLINLLLLSESPHSKILATLLWLGGLGVFILCAPIVQWGVTLARIPRWRLRRAGRIIQARQSFLDAMNKALQKRMSRKSQRQIVDSDADDDEDDNELVHRSLGDSLKDEIIHTLRQNFFRSEDAQVCSATEKSGRSASRVNRSSPSRMERRRRNTLPATINPEDSSEQNVPKKKKNTKFSTTSYFLSLTPQQVALRKWVYAAVLYSSLILLLLGPIRSWIGRSALAGNEALGWAIGYFFGDLREFRFRVVHAGLDGWIPLPPLRDDPETSSSQTRPRAVHLREDILGLANTRLAIAAHCLVVLTIGMVTVLQLSSVVEVDTRRKVFHGMMVAMLLPTIFIDPVLIALALIVTLTVFLVLDLLRASQLPPLSRPLAYFLTPYVDGRDLRGPVVISHIFLVIGCAVPLWLSLADLKLVGASPWQGWEAPQLDVSMISGVICVGMGDAAASLIGRRFGRHKWPWTGGKSLEGSGAFAIAVSIGLLFGKAWMFFGQWPDANAGQSWLASAWKALLAASGASFMEAVLTGGNDNVVVPVVLWVLVRALGM